MSLKAKIEAVLFVTSKPIKAQAIARIVNADVQAVRQTLLELVHDYEERKGGLEISDDDGYAFQVKDEYASLMDEFMPVEMSAALIRTLSAIAIKQPITQSEIIRIRGAGAYDHIRDLVAKELVSKREEQGERSPILSTTKKFQEYFKLSKEGKDLRNYLKRQVKKAEAADASEEKQLVIQAVVPNDADNQLNNQIYLETADEQSPDQDDSLDTTLVEIRGAEAPTTDVGPIAVAETAVVETAMVEPERVEATLSKLAEVAEEAHEPTPPTTSTPSPSTTASNVQAHSAKRKEPKISSGPSSQPKKSKQKTMPSSLEDLVNKQKLLAQQLKLGQLDDELDEQTYGNQTVESSAEVTE